MNYRRKKRAAVGFYVATGICLVAIGVAAVLSYSGVSKIPSEIIDNSLAETENSMGSVQKESQNPYTQIPKENPVTIPKTESETQSKASLEKPKESESSEENSENESTSEDESSEEAGSNVTAQPVNINKSYILPAGSRIIKDFSFGEPIYSETMRDYRAHNGTDYSADRGDTVHSIGYGEVLDVYSDDLLGNVILIKHSDYEVYYCGLGSTALVRKGAIVSPGEDIGSVLETPIELIEESHIHIEIKKNGEYIDPKSIFP